MTLPATTATAAVRQAKAEWLPCPFCQRPVSVESSPQVLNRHRSRHRCPSCRAMFAVDWAGGHGRPLRFAKHEAAAGASPEQIRAWKRRVLRKLAKQFADAGVQHELKGTSLRGPGGVWTVSFEISRFSNGEVSGATVLTVMDEKYGGNGLSKAGALEDGVRAVIDGFSPSGYKTAPAAAIAGQFQTNAYQFTLVCWFDDEAEPASPFDESDELHEKFGSLKDALVFAKAEVGADNYAIYDHTGDKVASGRTADLANRDDLPAQLEFPRYEGNPDVIPRIGLETAAGHRTAARGKYGEITTLRQPLPDVECWNSGVGERGTVPAGAQIEVATTGSEPGHINIFTAGIKLASGQIGYQFIVPRDMLAAAIGMDFPPSTSDFDLFGQIMAFEAGELGRDETIALFQHIVDNDLLDSLQGSYGRAARRFIEQGLVKPKTAPEPTDLDAPAPEPPEKPLARKREEGYGGRRVGPFMGVEFDERVTFDTEYDGRRSFRIVVYRAYNAHGLIGGESNGIAILDEDTKSVVADEIMRQDVGWYGATPQQLAKARALTATTWEDFREFVNRQKRTRYKIAQALEPRPPLDYTRPDYPRAPLPGDGLVTDTTRHADPHGPIRCTDINRYDEPPAANKPWGDNYAPDPGPVGARQGATMPNADYAESYLRNQLDRWTRRRDGCKAGSADWQECDRHVQTFTQALQNEGGSGAEKLRLPLRHQFAAGKRAAKSNEDVIRLFLADEFPKDKKPEWGTRNLYIVKRAGGWALINYATPLLFRENGMSQVVFNANKYSVTTSKIQSIIRRTAEELGVALVHMDAGGIKGAMDDAAQNGMSHDEARTAAATPPTLAEESAAVARYARRRYGADADWTWDGVGRVLQVRRGGRLTTLTGAQIAAAEPRNSRLARLRPASARAVRASLEEGTGHTCDLCGGAVHALGALGRMKHGRCRDCGAQWSWSDQPAKSSKPPKSKSPKKKQAAMPRTAIAIGDRVTRKDHPDNPGEVIEAFEVESEGRTETKYSIAFLYPDPSLFAAAELEKITDEKT